METKKCTACGEVKPIELFSFKQKSSAKRNARCKTCCRRSGKEHYASNKSYYIGKAVRRKNKVREECYERLFEYFSKHPCTDCGETDAIVLTFDHTGEKTNNVSTLIANGVCWQLVETEIAKCEVRCFNCHIRRTAKQFGWYKARSAVSHGTA